MRETTVAKPKGLHVGEDLTLPLDAITQSFALLAVRRAGKSNAAAVMAEEMRDAGLPWVAIDPKGDWWGLRSSADGTGPGLPIPIFGGLHGDLPLLPEAGRLIAEIIVDQNLTCVLDVSEFASKAAQMRFLADLGERLFRLHGRHPQPRHIFLEEADDVIPQRVMGDMARCVGAWSKLVKQGGSRGLGITLISQRSAVVNKDALTQTETMIALRTTSPQDQKAILEWVKYHAVAQEVVESLSGLDDGEAWVISPHWLGRHGQPAVQRVRFRRRATFDSGATPTVAKQRRPATLADIDLGALGERMAAVAEKAAQDDPAKLRRRIAEFERQLSRRGSIDPVDFAELAADNDSLRAQLAETVGRPAERVEVPVLGHGEIAALEQAITALRDMAGSLEIALSRASRPVPQPAAKPAPPQPAPPVQLGGALTSVPGGVTATTWPEGGTDAGPPLKKGAREMLGQLARHYPLRLTRTQVASLAGIKGSGSTFSSYFSALRIKGLVSQEGTLVVITPDGLAAAGIEANAPPLTVEEIRERWRSVLKLGARTMLDHLIERYPEPMTRAELAEMSGINPAGSTLSSYLSTLRSNGLVDVSDDGYLYAADVFFLTEGSTRA